MKAAAIHENLITADLFRILSKGFSYPSAENLEDIKGISNEIITGSLAEKTIIGQLVNMLSVLSEDDLRQEYSRLFLKKTVSLNESFCLTRLNAITDVAGFYKAFGLNPKSGDAPDSLPYELEFMAMLLVKLSIAQTEQQRIITSGAYKKFLEEHLAPFTEKFSKKMKNYDPIPFYQHLIGLMETLINKEKSILNH